MAEPQRRRPLLLLFLAGTELPDDFLLLPTDFLEDLEVELILVCDDLAGRTVALVLLLELEDLVVTLGLLVLVLARTFVACFLVVSFLTASFFVGARTTFGLAFVSLLALLSLTAVFDFEVLLTLLSNLGLESWLLESSVLVSLGLASRSRR